MWLKHGWQLTHGIKKYCPVALTWFYRKDCKSCGDRVILAINGTVAGTLLETHLK